MRGEQIFKKILYVMKETELKKEHDHKATAKALIKFRFSCRKNLPNDCDHNTTKTKNYRMGWAKRRGFPAEVVSCILVLYVSERDHEGLSVESLALIH